MVPPYPVNKIKENENLFWRTSGKLNSNTKFLAAHFLSKNVENNEYPYYVS